MTINEKINKLREVMKEQKIDIYLITSSDPHQSEYLSDNYKTVRYISGFTGSAGTVVITQNEVGLWTDGRYFIQAANEIKDTCITLFKIGIPGFLSVKEYIRKEIGYKGVLGFDGMTMSAEEGLDLEKDIKEKEATVKADLDIIGMLWKERPKQPIGKYYFLGDELVGESLRSKITRVRKKMKEYGTTDYILTSLDDIAWLFNIRGNDIPNNPVVMSYCYITLTRTYIFIDKKAVDDRLDQYFNDNNIIVCDYEGIYDMIRQRADTTLSCLVDISKINFAIIDILRKNKCKYTVRHDPTTIMKACKNPIEINNIRISHLKDGIAVTKFMYWLKNNKDPINEMDIVKKISELRKEQEGYIEPSFDTIAAAGPNAAMMHYIPKDICNKQLEKGELLLVDSGGQYLQGTTDITRTFAIGDPKDIKKEIKVHYTLVLKGMIDLSQAIFLYGICGTNLDVLARGPIWEHCIDYKCGTGHGVGFFLNVHEGPHGIRPRYTPQVLEDGMIVTDEPGIYVEGSHGIRIENELLVHEKETNDFGKFMEFETLTLAPIDIDCIITEMLTEKEKIFLNDYHKTVIDKISPYLEPSEKSWLKDYIKEI